MRWNDTLFDRAPWVGQTTPEAPAASTDAGVPGPLRRTGPGADRPTLPERPLEIAVDFDGVLFDHVPYVLRGFRDAHGIDLEEEGLRYWDFFQYRAVREKGLTWRCVRSVLDEVETDRVLHQAPPRDPHAIEVMAGWRTRGHRVHVVTARQELSRPVTEHFLEAHGVPHDTLRMEVSRKTGYDVLVDDAPHNVLMAAVDGTLALLMDHPYNRDVPTHGNPRRVHDWRDVEGALARRPRLGVAP